MEIKIRYIMKHKASGNIETKYYYLNQIEERPLEKLSHVFSDEYELLGRSAYVGFKDKNNNELYYGDFVVFYYGKHKDSLVWDIAGWDNLSFLLNERDERGASFEIVGNIYENPELKED